MRWMLGCWRRLRALARLDTLERGLDEEIRFHLDRQTDRNLRAGMRAEEARRAAVARFGGIERAKEGARDEFRPARLEGALRDLRHGVRALRRTPGFTVVASLTLALGIGATTAVFSVLNGILFRPLAYPDADRLVALSHTAPGLELPAAAGDQVQISATQYFTYRDENRTFEAVGAWSGGTATVTGVAEPEQVPVVRATFDALRVLAVAPALGRAFSAADDAPAAAETALLTHGYWQRRYGGDRRVVGRRVTIDAREHQIIGVMPEGFRVADATADLILPLRFDRASLVHGQFNYRGLGRLRPGVTLAEANADIARLIPGWLHAWPTPRGFSVKILESARFTPALRPLHAAVVGDIGQVLWILMATIGCVLLIACANVVNLLLVRADRRQQELALRTALGAGWARLARAWLFESLLLSAIGGALGLAIATAAVRGLVAAAPVGLPRLDEIAIDGTVLGFATAASLAAGLLFGALSLARQAAPEIGATLRSGGRTASAGRERRRTRSTLVVVQVALAVVLLVASGLMIRTFDALRAVRPGFTSPDTLQLVRLAIPDAAVADPAHVARLQRDITDRMAAIPGVRSVSFISSAPLEPFDSNDALIVEGRNYGEGEIPAIRTFKFPAPHFFHTAGIPLLAGRDLTWTDVDERRPVAVISENLARELWRSPAAALGKRIREHPTNPWREIVGVVGDVHSNGMHTPAPATVYWPALMERFSRAAVRVQRSVTFVLRSDRTGSQSLGHEIRAAVRGVGGDLPLSQIRTLGDVYRDSMARTSFTLVVLALAGAMALGLGIVGIFGAISCTVTERRREIGIRAALGALPGQLQRMFVRQAMTLAGIGVACGLAAAVILSRFMASLLFATSPLDPATYLVVAIGLAGAAALASYVPAQRATAVDPVETLRAE